VAGLAIPVEPFAALDVSLAVRGNGLRGAGGATARFFFLDDFGNPVAGHENGDVFLRWAGTFPWRVEQRHVAVPRGAIRAVLQIDKPETLGWLRVDDVRVTAAPDASAGSWREFHVADDTQGWLPVGGSSAIVAGSALDVSFLVPAPAGQRGFVAAQDGRLVFAGGGPARFLGVGLIPPAAFLEPERADALAARFAQSGINLVGLRELDTPFGSDRSLFDDTRDDTRAFDTGALARLDHLVGALKSHGIYVALELQGARRFRVGDGVELPGLLPPGGGPAAQFDPTISRLALESALALLAHENPETRLPLRGDPALAWVTLAGELTLFDLSEHPELLPTPYAKALHALAERSSGALGKRLWESVESGHSKHMADALRKDGLRVPVAGVSHWRRDPEFARALAGPGLDLVDDRIYWTTPTWVAPEYRSMLWSLDGGMAGVAAHKRSGDRPYAVSQWCNQTYGAWSSATEAADMLLGVYTAVQEDWAALVRRGVFFYPLTWGEGPSGTVGGQDIFQVAEVVNASPHIDAVWPHAASVFYRGATVRSEREPKPAHASGRTSSGAARRTLPGWDPARGRLVIDTPYTQALAGWSAGQPASLTDLEFSTDDAFAVLAATSIGADPITRTKRLLVSVVGRVEPTGLRFVNTWRHAVSDPGRPPFLQEPVRARVVWRHKGPVRGFALDNTGRRAGAARVEVLPGDQGVALIVDGRSAAFHYELVAP
jgi:hypothetical protein